MKQRAGGGRVGRWCDCSTQAALLPEVVGGGRVGGVGWEVGRGSLLLMLLLLLISSGSALLSSSSWLNSRRQVTEEAEGVS